MAHQKWARREFIENIGKNVLAGMLLAQAVPARLLAGGRSVRPVMTPIALDLAKPEYGDLSKPGGSMKIPDPGNTKKPIIVVRLSSTAFAAFSSKCTHWGCEVPLPGNNVVVCPCHKSMFDETGRVTRGPAKKNLKPFVATLDGTILTITEPETPQ